MSTPVSSARLNQLLSATDILAEGAAAAAKAATRRYREATRVRRGAALRPGTGTPLWNELARAAEKRLTRYGEKAKLARLLGLPRQRIHLLLVTKTACPDAERTLQLLGWLAARRAGRNPS